MLDKSAQPREHAHGGKRLLQTGRTGQVFLYPRRWLQRRRTRGLRRQSPSRKGRKQRLGCCNGIAACCRVTLQEVLMIRFIRYAYLCDSPWRSTGHFANFHLWSMNEL